MKEIIDKQDFIEIKNFSAKINNQNEEKSHKLGECICKRHMKGSYSKYTKNS